MAGLPSGIHGWGFVGLFMFSQFNCTNILPITKTLLRSLLKAVENQGTPRSLHLHGIDSFQQLFVQLHSLTFPWFQEIKLKKKKTIERCTKLKEP